ncbi:hypothetical protein ABFV99_13095 [Cytobacillus horneckiae]|uniref:hypothetical protein n=1 Tax=Cytobacillus horneckiae TaxID=549687 RepID=UPI0034CD058D
MVQAKKTYIEQHYTFSVSEFEGLWEMTFMHPFNREEHVSIYVVAPNSYYEHATLKDIPIVEAGPRLSEVLNNLLFKIEYYPYSWGLSGKKIVSYGYDFESDYTGTAITTIDLTAIAHKEVNEYFNFFSGLEVNVVNESETVSGKGVMSKLRLDLDRAKEVNDLSLDFFTEYPIELLSLMYQGTDGSVYEIPLSKSVQTNSSIHLHFSPVTAKTFFLIIKQESYTLINAIKSNEEISKNELWLQASERSQTLYQAAVSDYLDDIFPSQSGILLHQEIIDSYKNINSDVAEPSRNPLNPYRSDFDIAKAALDSEQR